MKKFFLLLSSLFFAFHSYGQQFVDGQGKATLNFATLCTRDYNAPDPEHFTGYAYTGGNITTDFSLLPYIDYGQTNALVIRTADALGNPATTSPAYFDILQEMQDSCGPIRYNLDGMGNPLGGYGALDLSGNNSQVVVYAQASMPTTVQFYLGYATNSSPEINSYVDNVIQTMEVTTTLQAFVLDFSAWQTRDRVNVYGFIFNDPSVNVFIRRIVFGAEAEIPTTFNTISGNVYEDTNGDCTLQTGETGLANILVEATDGQNTYWGYSKEDGSYSIGVESGSVTYAVTPKLNDRHKQFISNLCVPKLVVCSGTQTDFCCTDFGLKVKHCSLLSVGVNSDRRRRCFTSVSHVVYNNYGNTAVESAVVKVVYPEFTVPLSSVPAWTSKIGDTLIYQIGSIAAGGRGTIELVDSVICGREDIRGLSQCMKAIILPGSQCVDNAPAWDGSSVSVMPYCENGVARFVVQNVGLEDMAGSSQYRMYSNDTLVFQSTFQLISGNTFQVRYPANGAVIRLEADQRPSHPGRSQPRAFVEGCGTAAAQTSTSSESLVLSVPQDDLDEAVAISCMTIVDSYDPNDKAALPVGITDDHLVKAGERIQYTIRFQNTGSDVAYKVVVVDTLDLNLDMSTFIEGAASHAYVLNISTDGEKTILNYIFNNINLKDSTTSEPESHGFFSFYINSKEDLADGNTLKNKADIFFDYNSAIVTNVVDHTIGTYVPADLTKGNNVQVITGLFDGNATNSVQHVTLYPNPASDVVQVKLHQQFNSAQLTILDLSGHEVWSGALKGEITSVSLSTLATGMYLYKVMSNGEYVGVGKLLVK